MSQHAPIPPGLMFTIAICTVNRRHCVERAIDEVLRQISTVEHARLVIVDNGSTDGRVEYLSQVALTRSQLCAVKEPRLRLYYARAKAIESASGESIVFLDDDP